MLMLTMVSFMTGGASESMERAAASSGSNTARQTTNVVRGGARKAGQIARPAARLGR